MNVFAHVWWYVWYVPLNHSLLRITAHAGSMNGHQAFHHCIVSCNPFLDQTDDVNGSSRTVHFNRLSTGNGGDSKFLKICESEYERICCECWYVTVTATQKGRGKNRPTDQEILWVLEKNRLISQQFWVLVSVQPPQWAGHPYPTGTVRKPWGCLETPHPSYRPCRPQWSGIKSAKLPANTTRKNRISS